MPDNFFLFSLVIFIVFWFLLVYYIFPNFGGWASLAEKYATDRSPKYDPVKKLKIRNCNIGGLGYQNVVKFYEANDGLLLNLIWLFRGQQPNLLIPWKEIKQVERKKQFFNKYVRLEIGNPFVSYIEISERDYFKIKDKVEKYGR